MKPLTIIGLLAVCMIMTASVYAGLVYSDSIHFPWNPPLTPTPSHIYNLNTAMNEFALTLYTRLCAENSDNVFFSPYSIYIALAMAFEGANGATAEEMSTVLGYPKNNETMLSTIHYLWEEYNHNNAFNLSTANALWLRNGFIVLDDYIQKIMNYFGGNATELDFSNPVEAAKVINDWVELHTNGKIKDLVPAEKITDVTMLILTNAIYFNADWQHPFNSSLTADREFYIGPNITIQVPMMHMDASDVLYNYTETDTLQMIELPYAGGNVSMLILLPKDSGLAGLEQDLTLEQLNEWKESLQPKEVYIYLPRFTLETSYTLNDYLKQMGMTDAFSDMADFSGITGYKGLFIDSVLHKAFIEVNEEGTEAAAATAIIVTISIKPIFNADHPFLFIIQHRETGNILFMGKIVNPLE